MDYGKFKYSAQKKAAEAARNRKIVEIKEIKLRPMIDDHDYDVKMRAMQRFFEEGDKVKVTLRYRGREMAHQEIGTKLLDKVKSDVAEFAKVEQDARSKAARSSWSWRRADSSLVAPRKRGPIRRGPSVRAIRGRLSPSNQHWWLWVPAFGRTTTIGVLSRAWPASYPCSGRRR